jgi:four helix bundle protein
MDPNDLKIRTKKFAHRCIKLAMNLPKNSLGRHIQNQLVRCSTSVASNYRATCLSQSKKAFIAKISIVIEEIDETAFWLEFIVEEDIFSLQKINPLLNEAKELTSIFIASRITAEKSIVNIQ